MRIDAGLFDRMVLQRDAKGRCDATFSGESEARGPLTARVTLRGKPVRGAGAAVTGKASGGKVYGRLRGLPAGGPYDIELTVAGRDGAPADKLRVRGVLVGDVWIAGGQSNMQGCGLRPTALKPHPLVRAFYMEDRWDAAADPIHNLWDAVDPVHTDLLGGTRPAPNVHQGVGPAVAFAQEMHRLTGVPQGILACAHGGTTMTQWDPGRRDEGGKSLYGATVRRLGKNGGKVRGVIWYQGESDATPEAQGLYTERMQALVKALRRDARDPALPWAVVQLGRFCGVGFEARPWNQVQEHQRRLPETIKRLAVVPAADLALDDTIHISGEDEHRLGRRLAYAMRALTDGPRAGAPPVAFRRLRVEPEPNTGFTRVIVEFDHVAGALRAAGRPSGFTIVDDAPGPFIFDTQLDGDRVILRTTLPVAGLDGKSLHYGHGTDPFCNIGDAADRPLPVMGPFPITDGRALTPFVRSLRVAYPMPAPEDFGGLAAPADPSALPWKPMTFPERLCDLHGHYGPLEGQDFLIYYACRLRCAERMKLVACVGYDGPVKVWIDGREGYSDPRGTNPAWEDQGKVKFDAGPGEHEVLIALGSNHARAWGIFLRFERLGVPPRLVRRGPGAYAMPELLG